MALKDAELHRANAEVKSLHDTVEHQKVVMKETSDELRKVKESLTRYRKEADEKQVRVESLKEEFAQEKDRFEKRLELSQKTMKHEMKLLSDEKDELLVRLDEKESQLSQIKCDGMSLEEKLKSQYHSELNKLTIENKKLIKVSQQLQNELETTKAEKEYAGSTLRGAIEVLQKQLNEVSNENKMLSTKNLSQEEVITELKSELRDVQRGLETVTNDLHVKEMDLVESENKNKDLGIQNELLTSRFDERTDELLAERREKERLDKLYQDSEKKNQALLQKEKMKSNAYKMKALEAHAKTMQAKQLLREIPK
jgi:chromosome segregation ATPase